MARRLDARQPSWTRERVLESGLSCVDRGGSADRQPVCRDGVSNRSRTEFLDLRGDPLALASRAPLMDSRVISRRRGRFEFSSIVAGADRIRHLPARPTRGASTVAGDAGSRRTGYDAADRAGLSATPVLRKLGGAVLGAGASCALGFCMKTVMFLLGAALLALLFLIPPKVTRARSRIVMLPLSGSRSGLPRLPTSSPEALTSYGETGRLNYGWFVSSKGYQPLKVCSMRRGRTRRASCCRRRGSSNSDRRWWGTFPLHADPSYWWQGTPTSFHGALRSARLP